MATLQEYQDLIGAEFMAHPAAKKLYEYPAGTKFTDYFPVVSIEGVFVYVFAFGLWIADKLFLSHRSDVSAELTALKAHTPQWYANKAKAYQHGYTLPKDDSGFEASDTYATIDHAARIVKYSIAKEIGNILLIKVAKYTGTADHAPQKLTDTELMGVKRYFSQIKDCGVPIAVISNDPDYMAVELVVYYNPMLLFPDKDANGNITALRDSEGVDVIHKNIQQVIENLPFNGDCRKADIETAIENIAGADVVDVTAVYTKAAAGTYTKVVGYCTPSSGYFKLDKLTLTAKPYSYGNEI